MHTRPDRFRVCGVILLNYTAAATPRTRYTCCTFRFYPKDTTKRTCEIPRAMIFLVICLYFCACCFYAGYELVRLPEDNTLSGFTPLLCNVIPSTIYVPPDTDIESAQFALRLHRLLFFGTEFLCGVEPPVLKLEYRNDTRGYVSVVCTTANRSAPNTPPEFVSLSLFCF